MALFPHAQIKLDLTTVTINLRNSESFSKAHYRLIVTALSVYNIVCCYLLIVL